MTSAPRRRLKALSEQLSAPAAEPGKFENISKVRQVAPDSREPRLRGKVCIITGANSLLGIGRATAHQFAAQDARAIYLCDFDPSNLSTHERELSSLFPSTKIHTQQLDASDGESVKSLVASVLQTYGQLDVFFANAGISGTNRLFEDVSPDEFMHVMRTNLLSVFVAAKHAAPAMKLTSSSKKHPDGSIVATASVAGLRSNAGASDYSASKAGVISLMQTIAWQLAHTGIRANAICPGLIETGMTAPMYEVARQRGTAQKIGQLNPTGRGGVADEIARVACFLASAEASYVNGQAWAVDGGLSAGLPVVGGKIA